MTGEIGRPRTPEERTTIHTIAREAGVSTSTVSRVVNQPNLVRPKTRDAVYEAMRAHGYAPPPAKHDPASRSYVIGLAVPNVELPFVSELIRDIQLELESGSYSLLLIDLKGERRAGEYFSTHMDYRNKIDALILFSSSLDEAGAEFFRSTNLPVILIQSRSRWAKCISTNNFLGGHDATDYLLGRGYREIGFVGWTPHDEHLQDRLSGYRSALERAGIEFTEERIAYSELSSRGGYEAASLLLDRTKPDAILFGCDTMALGGLQLLREQGLRVPRDIGVMGFDDIELADALGLTTMKQFIRHKASMAMSYLLDMIEGRKIEPDVDELCITPRVVRRDTTR